MNYFKNDFFFFGGGDKIYLSIAPIYLRCKI